MPGRKPMYLSIDVGLFQEWQQPRITCPPCGHDDCVMYVIETVGDELALYGTYEQVMEFLTGAAQRLALLHAQEISTDELISKMVDQVIERIRDDTGQQD